MQSDPSKFIFLDRDGVINERNFDGYILSIEDFHFKEDVFKSLSLLKENGFQLILITNQQCVGKGLISMEDLEKIHQKMNSILKEKSSEFTDIFCCPHRKEENCECRKPRPGMLFQARDRYGITLKNTYFIGDSDSDMKAAENAGCQGILAGGIGQKSLYEAVQQILQVK